MTERKSLHSTCFLMSLLLVCAMLLIWAPTVHAAETPVQEARSSVVRIYSGLDVKYWETREETVSFTGTGVCVGAAEDGVRYIITNKHVVNRDALLEEVKASEDRFHNAQMDNYMLWVLAYGVAYKVDYAKDVTLSQIADLAIIRLNKAIPNRVPAVLGDPDEVQVTDTVYAIGFPGFSDVDDVNNDASDSLEDYVLKNALSDVENMSVTKGTVVKTHVTNTGIDHIQHDATVGAGSSGGPLVTEKGYVVGLNSWVMSTDIATANYAIDTEAVKTFLRQNKVSWVDSADIIPAEEVIVAEEPVPEEAAPEEPAPEETPEPVQEEPEKKSNTTLYLVIGAVAALAVIAAVVAAGRKKKIPEPAPVNEEIGKTVAAGVAAANTFRKQTPYVRSLAEQHGNRNVPLGRDSIVLGRSSSCKIVYQEDTPGVSGRHCAITWDSEKQEFIVKDLESTYGTYRESGMRLEPNRIYRLKAGESIYLGEKTNTVRLEVE